MNLLSEKIKGDMNKEEKEAIQKNNVHQVSFDKHTAFAITWY